MSVACLLAVLAALAAPFQLAVFREDITIPLGHACMGGGISPATEVVDPLYAHGVVLLGPDKPLVFVAVDWCEIRNDAYDHWRTALAEAAGEAGVARFVSLSSVKAMGEPRDACIDEDWPVPPESAYGQAKRAAEDALLAA
ncbi:MAG TPA: NAD-dependent epimerase/dehydratase family protein, partial [Candidatus Hydrogenedentes bacterium]|nr:NAD-dependent epimerase/dehydratase family protein [Candidatus Hydrogenedentota bacterium]